MDLYPAIDLLDGRCVRLRQGDFRQVTAYSDDPLEVARDFARDGAAWIHVVDLNGARTGVQSNLPLVRDLARMPGIRLQLGGGLRDAAAIGRALDYGVSRCVVGTAALDPVLLRQIAEQFAGRVAVGVDVAGGTVRVSGWTEDSGIGIETFLHELQEASVAHVILTDISRDGMLSGPNISLLARATGLGFGVIASGGVSSLEDLESLAAGLPELEGVIVGKALYEGRFTVKEALAVLGRPFEEPRSS